jgi:hypothetical protein
MAGDHALEEHALCMGDVFDCLTGLGFGEEADEVARMTCVEGYPNLALRLEAADARSMASARIDDDEGALAPITLYFRRRHDLYQYVVHWPLKFASVHYKFACEFQDMRSLFCGMLKIALAPLL